MDIGKIKKDVLALEIESKLAEGLANDKKPWLFYEAQVGLDALIKVVAESSGPGVSAPTIPSLPGRGGPLIPPPLPSPGRGGPPLPRAPVQRRGGPPPTPSSQSGSQGASPVEENEGYKLRLISDLKDGRAENAEVNQIYLDENGTYFVRAPFGVIHKGNLKDELKNLKNIDITDINEQIKDPAFKNGVLSITHIFGHTKAKNPEYTLHLMSDLKDNKATNAEMGKIYLGENGTYFVRGPNREVHKGNLNIDMDGFELKLNDNVFKSAVLEATAKAGYTQLITPDKRKLQYLHDQFKNLKILLTDSKNETETKTFLEDMKAELESALPNQKFMADSSNVFKLEMDLFATSKTIEENHKNIQEEAAQLTKQEQKIPAKSDVLKSMKAIESFFATAPEKAPEKEKSFVFKRGVVIDELTKDKGKNKCFLSKYTEDESFRNEVNDLNGGEIFEDKDILAAIKSVGLLKERYKKLNANKVAALANWEAKKEQLSADESKDNEVLKNNFEQEKEKTLPEDLEALEEKFEEDKKLIAEEYKGKRKELDSERVKLIAREDALIQKDPDLKSYMEEKTKIDSAIKKLDLTKKPKLQELVYTLEQEKDSVIGAISDENDALREIHSALNYIKSKDNFTPKDEKDVKTVNALCDIQKPVINLYNSYLKLVILTKSDIDKANIKADPLLKNKAVDFIKGKISSKEKLVNQAILNIKDEKFPKKDDTSSPPTQTELDEFNTEKQRRIELLEKELEAFKLKGENEIKKLEENHKSLELQCDLARLRARESLLKFYKKNITQIEHDISNYSEEKPQILGNPLLLAQLNKMHPYDMLKEQNVTAVFDENLDKFFKTNMTESIKLLSAENADLVKDELNEYLPIRADSIKSQVEFQDLVERHAKDCEAAVKQITQNGKVHLPSLFSTQECLKKVQESLTSAVSAVNIIYKAPKEEVVSAASNLEIVKTLQEATIVIPTADIPTGDFFELKSETASGTRLNMKSLFSEETGKVKCTDVTMQAKLTELTDKGAKLPNMVLLGLASGYLKVISPPGFQINSRIIRYTPKENFSKLFLISELPKDTLPEKNTIYLEKSGDKLKYVTLNPKNPKEKLEATLDINIPDVALTRDKLDSLASVILEETTKRGHARSNFKDNIRVDVKKQKLFEQMVADVYAQINHQTQNYELFLKSDLKEGEKPKEKSIYLEKEGDKIKYVMLNPNFDKDQAEDPIANPKIIEHSINIDLGADELTEDTMAKFKTEILRETAKAGHTFNKVLPEQMSKIQEELKILISTSDCKAEVAKLAIEPTAKAKAPTVFKVELEKEEALKRAAREKARIPPEPKPESEPKAEVPLVKKLAPQKKSGFLPTPKKVVNTNTDPSTDTPSEKMPGIRNVNSPLILSNALGQQEKQSDSKPENKKIIKELQTSIKDDRNKLQLIIEKISKMEILKEYVIKEFDLRGGEGALNLLKKQKTELESSIAKNDAEVKRLSGIVVDEEIDESSIKINKMIKALEGGIVVKKEDQIEVLKSASSSITNLKDEKGRLESLKNLPEHLINEAKSGKSTDDLFKHTASICLDKSEFSKILDDTLGKISGNRELLKACQGLYKVLMQIKQRGGFEAQYDTYKPTSSQGLQVK